MMLNTVGDCGRLFEIIIISIWISWSRTHARHLSWNVKLIQSFRRRTKQLIQAFLSTCLKTKAIKLGLQKMTRKVMRALEKIEICTAKKLLFFCCISPCNNSTWINFNAIFCVLCWYNFIVCNWCWADWKTLIKVERDLRKENFITVSHHYFSLVVESEGKFQVCSRRLRWDFPSNLLRLRWGINHKKVTQLVIIWSHFAFCLRRVLGWGKWKEKKSDFPRSPLFSRSIA